MEICSCHHAEIVYAEGNCPLCDLKVQHDMVVEALNDDIQVLEDTIRGLKGTMDERWEADR